MLGRMKHGHKDSPIRAHSIMKQLRFISSVSSELMKPLSRAAKIRASASGLASLNKEIQLAFHRVFLCHTIFFLYQRQEKYGGFMTMSIHALPQAAVRTLRSGQALTDPVSVVKELIDNALDARASNITIEISANTLDVIQVKDNGHGIAPTDRPLVAKPYCTSKLKDEKDLALVGSSYLGFRGEALSSALEMSGGMTITTRVEGESVATAIKICQTGDPVQDRATHPPGTTIRIANFLKNQPVRKQVALKAASKTLTKIRQLLQSYAFARPATRLSLKVIKAKNDKDNYTYAPKIGGGIEDTAFKVLGQPCASQCVWAELEYEGFTVEAFLPRPDAHASKISGLGQYVSVNDRPLTSSRGISRQLVRIYKESLKESTLLGEAKDPFLYLSISCPPGSYDVNIEPAKDDVLFGEDDKVVEAVRRLMLICYPEKDTSGESTVTHEPTKTRRELFATPGPAAKSQRVKPMGNMYDLDEDDLTLFMDSVDQPREAALEEEEQPESITSAAVSNPWITAKMNAYSNKKGNVNIQLLTPAKQASSLPPGESSPFPEAHHPQQDTPALPTPRQSSPMFIPSEEPESAGPRRVIGPSNLPPPVLHMSPMQSSLEAFESSPAPHPMFDSLQQASEGTPLDMIPEAAPRRRSPPKQKPRQFVNKPFVSPVDPERDAWFHFPESQTSKQFARKGRSQRQSGEGLVPNGEPYTTSSATPPANNTDIRNFLGRGQEQQPATPAISVQVDVDVENESPDQSRREMQPKGFVKASELDLASTHFVEPTRPAPAPKPRRRRTTDERALRDTSGNGKANDDDSGSEYEDRPRRRRTGESDPKRVRRIKSSTLPLEMVPADVQIQGWTATLSSTVDDLTEDLQNVEPQGTFVAWNAPAFDTEADLKRTFVEGDVKRWTFSISQSLLRLEPQAELVRDVGDVVRNAMGRWGTITNV
jgi:DNA mismatch repair protein MutL